MNTMFEITVGTARAINELGMQAVASYREHWADKLVNHFGGVTVLRERGGSVTMEGTVWQDVYIYRVVEFNVTGERYFIDKLAAEMADTFGEESVLVTETQMKATFIRGGGVTC